MATWPLAATALSLAAALLQTNELEQRVRDPDPDVRCRAVDSARRAGTPEAARLIAPLLADPHPRVRARAAVALSAMPRAAPALAELLKVSEDPAIRAGCARALGGHADALRAALDDRSPEVQAAAAESLLRQKERVADAEERFKRGDWRLRAALAPLVEGAIEDPDPRVRIAAAEALKDPPVERLLGDADWRLRSMGVDAARKVRTAGTVALLIARLAREQGRLAHEIADALADLTGEAFGPDAKAWDRWWRRKRGPGFECPPAAGPRPTQLQEGFFGMSMESDRVVFVIDLSGSMRGAKLDAARTELILAIRRLSDAAKFNVVLLGCAEDGTYDRSRRVWEKSMRPATEAARARAIEFVRAQEARGYTNLFDALAVAFEDPEADSIYLFSDGGASRGTFVWADEILEQVAAMNRFRRIRIHAVQAVSADARDWQARLMKGLADRSGGRYLKK